MEIREFFILEYFEREGLHKRISGRKRVQVEIETEVTLVKLNKKTSSISTLKNMFKKRIRKFQSDIHVLF